MEIWIPLTVVAAALQTLRSMLQKRATGPLSVNGASYLRFCYALPFAWLYLLVLLQARTAPDLPGGFFAYCLLGGVAQIAATGALLASFKHGNFVVGTTFSKTEVALTAVTGFVLLGDRLDVLQGLGIALSFFGVALLTQHGGRIQFSHNRSALAFGVAAGVGIAVAAVSYRGASLSLPAGDFLLRASLTLAITLTMQTVLLGAYLALREPGELTRVAQSWRSGLRVGFLGGAASACWFSAMTLVNAGLVRAVGQVELLFSFAASIWFLREKVRLLEVLGALLVVLGIWLLL